MTDEEREELATMDLGELRMAKASLELSARIYNAAPGNKWTRDYSDVIQDALKNVEKEIQARKVKP